MYFHRFACLIAFSASLLAPLGGQAARAADGIKATAVVEKRVPADLLTVTFHVVETMEPDAREDLLQFEARLRKDIEAIGARIVRVSIGSQVVHAGFNTSHVNRVPPTPADSKTIEVQRSLAVVLAGVRDSEKLIVALTRTGIRHAIAFAWWHSAADTVLDQMSLEAVRNATAQARLLAQSSGARAGNPIDLIVSLPSAPVQIPGNIVQITGQTIVFPAGPPYDRARPIATLVEHGPEGPILNLRVVATVTLAALAN